MICLIFIERTYFLDKKFVYSIHIIEGADPNTHRNLEGTHWKFCMSDDCTSVVRLTLLYPVRKPRCLPR